MSTKKKREYKSSETSLSQSSSSSSSDYEHEPSPKRRRLSLSQSQSNERQHYLTKNLIKLRDDSKVSDVTFVVRSDDGSVVKYKCIKALFAANSEVFRNLLFGDFNEAKSVNPVIEIKDITCCAFEYIRNLFYMLDPKLTADAVLDVAIAAHRYFIEPVAMECIQFLRNVSNIRTWFDLLLEVESKCRNCFGTDTYLKALIDQNFLVNNCASIIFGDLRHLYALNERTFARLIRSENVSLCEEQIWHKCVGYSAHKTMQKFGSKLPEKLKNLIDAHVEIPHKISQKNKNWQKYVVNEDEILFFEGLDGSTDEKEDNEQEIISFFERLMRALSQNIRFQLMAPLFFIRLVQFSEILSAEKIIAIQNYFLCQIEPKNEENFITTKREKKSLKCFESQPQVQTFDIFAVCFDFLHFANFKIFDHIDHRDNGV